MGGRERERERARGVFYTFIQIVKQSISSIVSAWKYIFLLCYTTQYYYVLCYIGRRDCFCTRNLSIYLSTSAYICCTLKCTNIFGKCIPSTSIVQNCVFHSSKSKNITCKTTHPPPPSPFVLIYRCYVLCSILFNIFNVNRIQNFTVKHSENMCVCTLLDIYNVDDDDGWRGISFK